jgi:hypothetical protein
MDVKSDKDLVQDEIDLDVERIDDPASIKQLLDMRINAEAGFQHIGETRKFEVTGVLADGTEVDLRRSRLNVYICIPDTVGEGGRRGSRDGDRPASGRGTPRDQHLCANIMRQTTRNCASMVCV